MVIMSDVQIPSVLGCSETIDDLLVRAERNLNLNDTIEELQMHAMPRFVCEVREIAGFKPLFSATSVTSLRVDLIKRNSVLVKLDGNNSELSCEAYYKQCQQQPAFKGFVFTIITAVEDIVHSVTIAPCVLPYRMTMYYPDNVLDFTLCIIIMYLESCGTETSPSLFVQLSVFLRLIENSIGPLDKMRKFLYIGVTWLLNTLMRLVDNSPFVPNRVLPHYALVKILHPFTNKSSPPVLQAIYTCGVGDKFKLPENAVKCPDGIVKARNGLLNAPLRSVDYQNVLYFWWSTRLKMNICDGKLFEVY
ncbi:unknown [Cercopithecine alphaherpesvirus 9]|uniref:Uncharacterized protein n=1 Tax=Cercopithecine herpesvirus 9 (strain DHV) TaxID=36348 RepID=Q9E1W7_CHV9D|nr:tegument protein UL7 [Cercopithecine alphaherpesvirus 9]AAG27228.1 unknown [Cercopithecine alphaherpesvirus 9]